MEVALSSHWYALNVQKNRERSVSSYLHQMQVHDYLPLQKCPVGPRSSKRIRQQPLFPGYVFCHLDLSRSPKLYQIPGFIRIVGVGKRPIHLDDSEIETIRCLVEGSVFIEPCRHYSIGDKVTLTSGPFVGVRGIVLQTRGLRTVVVSLPLLMRSIAVTVPQDWVMPATLEIHHPPLDLDGESASVTAEQASVSKPDLVA